MKQWTREHFNRVIKPAARQFYKSVWFFPVILLIPLLGLTALKISGSSIGTHHQILYGVTAPDPNVVLGEPRPIRSDEWLVNTQKAISQAENNHEVVNTNNGKGENASIIGDVAYKDWSVLFKPHNLPFLVLPLEYAFAMKWWLMAYLLMVSAYFFVLAMLPGRRMIAALVGIGLFFSPFVQWWYLYGTLASMYYPLLIMTAIIYLCRQTDRRKRLIAAGTTSYLIACFILVLYPPFQIGCGLVMTAFLLGYGIQHYKTWGRRQALIRLGYVAASAIVALVMVGAFVATRADAIRTTMETDYPGQRTVAPGRVYPMHLFSSQLSHQFLDEKLSSAYLIDGVSTSNQSENSNFLLLIPFLFLPALALVDHIWRRKRTIEWPILLLCGLFFVFLLEMFVPPFSSLSKLFLLDKVGGPRLMMGLGMLNIVLLVALIASYAKQTFTVTRKYALIYTAVVFLVVGGINLHIHYDYVPFVSAHGAFILALPFPLIIYMLLRKHFTWALALYALFAIFSAGSVNPLYRGLDVITDDPLSNAIEEVGAKSDRYWVSDGGYLENIASINGERSLSGAYLYPQLELWKDIKDTDRFEYNRYAHVGFQIADQDRETELELITPDSFVIKTDTCDPFLKKNNIGYFISSNVLTSDCVKRVKTIPYPMVTLYIYELQQ